MMKMVEFNSQQMYDLILAFSSYTELKRKILIALAHIYPKAVSGTQLSKIIGYSGKARTLYRGVLNRLKEDNVILVDKLTPKLFSIRINHNHELMKFLITLSQVHGVELKGKFEQLLDKDELRE